MKKAGLILVLSASWYVALGCASRQPAAETPVATRPSPATTRAVVNANDPATLPLDRIEPVPVLPAPRARPATQPTPLESLQLFAEARAALSNNPPLRTTAINLLEKAAAIDPYSPEIYDELSRAYGAQEKALPMLEKAIELDPDNLSLHERMGRQCLLRGKLDEALKSFRLATLTTEYGEDEESAAVIDFFLARALQRKGYDRAALTQYALLMKRLDRPTIAMRNHPELLGIRAQPETILGQMGELYEKNQQWEDAIAAYRLAVEHAPENFDLQSRLARTLASAGQAEEAIQRASAQVARYRANPDSLRLLREVYQKLGREGEMIDVLSRLHQENPADKPMLFALADTLITAGRGTEAETLLRTAVQKTGDTEVVRRLFDVYDKRDDVESAVRLLVEALARQPDSLREYGPMWGQLLKPSRRRQLRLPLLQKMKVPPEMEASRLFWVSRVADLWNRDALARSALEQGALIRPPFAPIMRSMIGDYWSRPDWDEKQKIQTCQKLIESVRQQGSAALATELEGQLLLRQKGKAEEAANKLAQSVQQGNKSPDVQYTQAMALLAARENAKAESLLWKVVSDTPTYEDAYEALFGFYLDQSQPSKAINVLSKWLAADPGNLRARVWRIRIMGQGGRSEAAEADLLALFRDDPRNSDVLGAMFGYYSDQRKIEEFLSVLEEERKKNPDNREVAEMLVTIYHQRKQLPQALRVLDATRAAVASDPDLLYYVANVYGRIDQKQTQEKLLEDVLKLDPRHAPASNDLGYTWADEGKNLSRAEDLIRVAVEAEPDNQSFLDSLGWVLYKRSKFAESRVFFERAIGPATRPDAVVLDHMGDVLYRLGDKEGALKQWKWASKRLDETHSTREDLKKLRLQLLQKLRQAEKGQPVEVAPVVEKAGG